MPLDKHNSIMAKATGLISSLLNFTLSSDVSFCQPQQFQCLHHGSIEAYVPLFSFALHAFYVGDNLRYAHYGFSTRFGKVQS